MNERLQNQYKKAFINAVKEQTETIDRTANEIVRGLIFAELQIRRSCGEYALYNRESSPLYDSIKTKSTILFRFWKLQKLFLPKKNNRH